MKENWLKKIVRSPLFIIAVLVCAANWQLLFCVKSLQWDMMNFWFPWRYFIAECYTNGIVPLWDPYTQAGYPVHGDLQGPAYNPETIIGSLLFNGSLYYLNYLFIGYLVLGAYGFYKLCGLFGKMVRGEEFANLGALAAGVIYALSGYNTGFGHYLYITVSVCLVPWMYYYVLKILHKGAYADACKLAIFVFMQVTAGNPSFLIVSGYFFLIIVLLRLIEWLRKKEVARVLMVLKQYSLAVVLIILMCLPVVINAYYVFPETTRGKGISLEWAAQEHFALRNLFTFFTPLVALEREYQAGANQPIFDYYIGLATLFFAAVGFIKYRSYWVYVFTGIAVVSFLLAIGLKTPVYGWFHSSLPLFNVFRMPRLIFLYCQLFLLLLASLGITYFLSEKVSIKWFLFFVILSAASGIASVLYFDACYFENGKYVTDYSSIRFYLWSASQYHKAAISLGITGIILLFSIILYLMKKRKLLIALLVLDVMVNYSLGAIGRNFSETKGSVTNSYTRGLPKGFACPENIAMGKVTSLTKHFNEFWLNACVFIKQPGYSNDNNFELSNYMKMYNDDQRALNYFIRQPIAFLSDTFVKRIDESAALSKKVFTLVDSAVVSKYAGLNLLRSPGDTVIFKKFEPQHEVFEVISKSAVAFVLQQNLTKLWHVYVDGGEVKPELCYYSFPLISLPEGKHIVEFKYQVPHYKLFFGLSLFVFGGCMFFILFYFKNRGWMLGLFTVLVMFCSAKFFIGKSEREKETIAELQQAILKDSEFKGLYIANSRDVYFPTIDTAFSKFNFIYPEDVAAFSRKLNRYKGNYLYYLSYKTYSPPELEAIIQTNFGKPIRTEKNRLGVVTVYKRDPQKQFILFEKDFNISKTNPEGIELKKGKEWGPTVEFRVGDIKADKYDLVFAEADVECGFDDFKGLCLSVENGGKNKRFLAYNFIHHPGTSKQSLSFYCRLHENTKPGDVIKAFVWNDDERPLILKDFKLKVISSDVFSQ